MAVLSICRRCGKILPGPSLQRQIPGVPIVDNRPEYEKNCFCSGECERSFNELSDED